MPENEVNSLIESGDFKNFFDRIFKWGTYEQQIVKKKRVRVRRKIKPARDDIWGKVKNDSNEFCKEEMDEEEVDDVKLEEDSGEKTPDDNSNYDYESNCDEEESFSNVENINENLKSEPLSLSLTVAEDSKFEDIDEYQKFEEKKFESKD